jgi:pilus assembly protein Flp/PilA
MKRTDELGARKVLAALDDRKGVTAVEYGLIAGLIAVAIIAALALLGTNLSNLFNFVASNVANS